VIGPVEIGSVVGEAVGAGMVISLGLVMGFSLDMLTSLEPIECLILRLTKSWRLAR
jgi:hypothetical protein